MGLVGPNGAGKSALFSVMSGFFLPDSGTAWLRGRDIPRLPPHQRVGLGLVRTFQVPREFAGLSVLENLMVAPLEQRGERLARAWFRWGQVMRQERALQEQATAALWLLHLEPAAAQLAGVLFPAGRRSSWNLVGR